MGGLARLGAAYPPKLVVAVLKGIRQQMLLDGDLSELDLKFGGPVPSMPVFDLNEPAVLESFEKF